MVGGYAMLDCSGLDLGNLGTVSGLYDALAAALETGKPLELYGVKNGTQGFSPIIAYGGRESASSLFVSFFPITLHISSSDVVTM